MPGRSKLIEPRFQLSSSNHEQTVLGEFIKKVVGGLALRGAQYLDASVALHVFSRILALLLYCTAKASKRLMF